MKIKFLGVLPFILLIIVFFVQFGILLYATVKQLRNKNNFQSTAKTKVPKMKFETKTRNILLCLCGVGFILDVLVFLRVLPFIIFLIGLLIQFGMLLYISYRWSKWKNDFQLTGEKEIVKRN